MKKILSLTTVIFLTSCFSDVSNTLRSGVESVASATSVLLPDGYQKDFTQGISISAEQIDALKLGMSKFEVRKLIGSPTIDDPFRKNRWDYIDNSLIDGERVFSQLTLFFSDENKLIEIIPRSGK